MTRVLDRLQSPRVRLGVLGIVFAALLLPTAWRICSNAESFIHPTRGSMVFNDFRLFLRQVKEVEKSGQLYATRVHDFFEPSSSVYKYPPPFAALLSLFSESRWQGPARVMLWSTFALLAATAVILLWRLRPRLAAALVMLLVFLNWQPFWESIAGLQLEPALLFLLSLSLLLWSAGRDFLSGFFVGIAAALKVYPVGLGVLFLVKRSPRGILGVAAGGLFTLGLAALRLSPAHSVEYFTRILPRLGGTSLWWENLGILSFLGRATIRLLGVSADSGAGAAPASTTTLESHGAPEAVFAARALFLVVTVLLVFVTFWKLGGSSVAGSRTFRAAWVQRLGRCWPASRLERAATPVDPSRRRMVEFAVALCLLLPLMPTSWYDYQTLLVLPALVAIRARWSSARGWIGWVLLGFGILPAVLLNANGTFTTAHPVVSCVLRAVVPFGLWGALLPLGAAGNRPVVSCTAP